MQSKFEIGKIVNTFGIKGEVKVTPYTDNINQFKKLKSIYVDDKLIEIESVKFQNSAVIIKLKDINTIAEAENLRNSSLWVERTKSKLPENTYYIADLIGLEVYTDEGEKLGTVLDIYNTGANDIYEIKTPENKKVLLPAIKDVIKNIDLEEKKITVHILKGLI